MVTAIVSGATGLVGYNTVAALLAEQYEVYALGRNKQKLTTLQALGAHPVQLDITQPIATWPDLPKHAYWFHCAAAVSGASQGMLTSVNVEGTRKLVDEFFAKEGQYFVHISTISVYSLDQGIPLQENSEKNPTSIYGLSKLQAEQIVIKAFTDKHVTNYTILRPPFICGPKDQNFVHELAVRLAKKSPILISRDALVGILDARDLAIIMIATTTNPEFEAQVVNVQGHALSFHHLVRQIAVTTQLPKPRKPLPYSLAMLIGALNELVKKIKGKNADKGLSRYRIRSLTTNRYLDTTKLEKLLPFTPIPLQQSLNDWWKESTLQ